MASAKDTVSLIAMGCGSSVMITPKPAARRERAAPVARSPAPFTTATSLRSVFGCIVQLPFLKGHQCARDAIPLPGQSQRRDGRRAFPLEVALVDDEAEGHAREDSL